MDTKYCSQCQKTKNVDDFYKRKGRAVGKCKECAKANSKKNYRNRKAEIVKEKTCSKCEITKKIEFFGINGKDINGNKFYRGICKECLSNNKKKRRIKNNEMNKNNSNFIENKYPEHIKLCSKCKIPKKLKEFYHAGIDYHSNCKKCSSDHTKQTRKQIQKRVKRNEENNPVLKVRRNLRTRIISALKNNSKSISTIKLLGCSISFYKQWLEWRFDSNMTWNNYGIYWHIDHVKPCSSFDLIKISEQYKCFNWKNTQPLEKSKNIVKSNKILLNHILFNELKVKVFEKHLVQVLQIAGNS